MVFLGIDWGKIFSAPFWLEVSPGELSPLFEKYFLAVFFISYFFFFFSKIMQKRLIAKRSFIKANYWHKIGTFFLTMAVSFTFIFFFRYEAIPVLGGRFWIFLWILGGLIWAGFLLKGFIVELPQELKSLENKQKFNKYLVKGKKNKK